MFLKKIATTFIATALLTTLLSGCGDGNTNKPATTTSLSSAPKTCGASEPTLHSTEGTQTRPGASFMLTLDYKEQVTKEQIQIKVGDKPATIKSCTNNQVSVITPDGLPLGTHAITATVDGKPWKDCQRCEGEMAIEVIGPAQEKY
ncbi:hypothetical protein [Heliophilum fasciatum]|uniref:Ig-like domain-containing protein n=1 Tax=Heliophilum fasciatum TaxID=35700 RepID=A0A4R2RXD4_9FIRM|nr:hypothetical protein [Heliophilum fasciatum]MCW2277237.1 hypothetical protein [Heliophilum fasciatum]TCP68128.1 hypothetical protein EDD73_10430 [Heliophilum fasciatum]